MRQYPALIHKDPDSDFGVSFPDFPGCVSAGRTAEEAHQAAAEALQLHVDGMLDDGESLPEPTPLNEAYRLATAEGAIAVALVAARVPGRAKRVNVTIDENLLADLDAAASRRGMSRSAFLAEGARRLMGTAE